ncbi:hypothetical protein JXB28_04645 [Candidatus Woesearchaeota archaeon]|nr:hypothetical protein [Candidatus Woesearchaeota archaeon]
MHPTEQSILNKFKQEPLREISTTELIRAVYPEEYSRIIRDIDNEFSDKKLTRKAYQRKAQLHRKTLYHLNKLVSEGVLKVSSVHGKGEKHFSLNMEEGELVVEKKHKKIIISKPTISTSLIEEYESKGIVRKFDPDGWLTKLNCILLESSKEQGINRFYELAYNCFPEINDAIGLNNFEQLVQSNTPGNTEEVLKRLDIETKDHDRIVSIIINLKGISDQSRMIDFIKAFVRIKPRNINIIFKAESKELKSHEKLFANIIPEFSREELKLNIHNRKVHEAPIILGKAGPYTLREEEWKDYEEKVRGNTIGLAIADTTIIIDIHRLFSSGTSINEFRKLMQKISNVLLKVNMSKNKKAGDHLKKFDELNKPNTKQFFAYSRNYIRLWNYDLAEKSQEHLPELLESTGQEIKAFCSAQHTIYRACGIPFGFDIALSTVMRKFSAGLSQRRYAKATIRSFKDFHQPETMSQVQLKEKLSRVFDGGDRTRFFRRGEFTHQEILRELAFLMNTYELPLITYDFKERKGEIKLTNFIE